MSKPKLRRVQLCRECRFDGGWHYPDNGEPFRCPNITAPTTDPETERDAAISGTADAHTHAFDAALRIIRDAARVNPVLSSNMCRPEMEIAQIPGPVRGAAWRQACADQIIRVAGTEPSNDPGTHAHHIRIYESLIFRSAA